MGLEIDLAREILDPKVPDVVTDQGDGHDQGDEPGAVVGNELAELGPSLPLELLAKVAHAVLEHVTCRRAVARCWSAAMNSLS